MLSSWIIDPDPIITMDLVEILQQQFADAAPRVFESAAEALDVCDPTPALAILRSSGENGALASLLERLSAAGTRLILLETATPPRELVNARTVPLPFSSEHIIAALNALFDGSQTPTLRPDPR